ncbi:retrovirus-related Pol polyprotein from transposon 17.6 [Trichonephila clavipes]|nr:retrovirus-related Pol polyprotein from transposon 17.6 [Trichonephila clavipes]
MLNSRELFYQRSCVFAVPISSTSEPSENSRVVDVTSCISDEPRCSNSSLHSSNSVSDQLINKFWELDSVPCAKPLTSLEEACEDHFVKTHSRDENGRYTVKVTISHSSDAVR